MIRSKAAAVAFAVATGMLASAHFGVINPTVIAADTNAYFDALVSRAGFWKGYSFRPKAGFGVESPYFSNQLEYKKDGGYQNGNSAPRFITYDSAMDAAKVVIPAWMQPAWTMVLGAGMGSGDSK